MDSFLSKEVLAGIARGRERALKRKNRLSVHMGDHVFRVLRLWQDGFAIQASATPELRGLVSVYDGPKMLYQCLIVCSAQEGDELRYEFKRHTAVMDHPAVDFVRDQDAPIALLS